MRPCALYRLYRREDTVVWNPWETMKNCYERFACVENAKAGQPVTVAPGKSWTATANFSVVDLVSK